MIGEAISDLSDISRSMNSELILQNGLVRALEFETSQLSKLGLYQLNFIASGNVNFLDAQTELVVIRIVQEALNNIVKHSSATEINIELNYGNHILDLRIIDNGRGFHKETDHNVIGMGLNNMYKRAQMLKGKCNVISNAGEGTIIHLQIPINEYKQAI